MKNLYRLLLLTLFCAFVNVGCDFSAGTRSSADEDNDVTNIDNSVTDTNSDNPTFGNNPSCSNGTNTVDGPDGFLWKSQSESNGKLVVLFPAVFTTEFLKVLIERPAGTFESATFTGFSNGGRQTWRGSREGAAFTGRLVVDAGNQECEWLVSDPSIRQD